MAEVYISKLDVEQTQEAIKFLKQNFEANLSRELNLLRVSAPLFVSQTSGLADTLTGVERMINFTTKSGLKAVVNQSLAKWKRMALSKYKLKHYSGLYTDMNAIRIDEVLSPIHSYYVDQWDWERVISPEERNDAFLEMIVRKIFAAFKQTEDIVVEKYPVISKKLPSDIKFIFSQELEDMYPDMKPTEREYAIVKKYGCVFIKQIGKILKSGNIHDQRAPDYDDWELNGDLIVYSELNDQAIELSSMGIRVNAESMDKQLRVSKSNLTRECEFHRHVLDNTYPLTIGGGIGQSRTCMFMLDKKHIGEVQVSLWTDNIWAECERNNIKLL